MISHFYKTDDRLWNSDRFSTLSRRHRNVRRIWRRRLDVSIDKSCIRDFDMKDKLFNWLLRHFHGQQTGEQSLPKFVKNSHVAGILFNTGSSPYQPRSEFTQRAHNFKTPSMQRQDVESTFERRCWINDVESRFNRRCKNAVFPLGNYLDQPWRANHSCSRRYIDFCLLFFR